MRKSLLVLAFSIASVVPALATSLPHGYGYGHGYGHGYGRFERHVYHQYRAIERRAHVPGYRPFIGRPHYGVTPVNYGVHRERW